MLNIVLRVLSGGKSTAAITESGKESGISQTFIAVYQPNLHQNIIEQIIDFTKTSEPMDKEVKIYYPGEKMLITRNKNTAEGILVNEEIWKQVQQL